MLARLLCDSAGRPWARFTRRLGSGFGGRIFYDRLPECLRPCLWRLASPPDGPPGADRRPPVRVAFLLIPPDRANVNIVTEGAANTGVHTLRRIARRKTLKSTLSLGRGERLGIGFPYGINSLSAKNDLKKK